jgi:GDP-D-mannose 3',5'-epimerase
MGDLVVVTGGGGFIGGHLINALRRKGVARIRAVDQKPLERWYQLDTDVESVQLDLMSGDACRQAVAGATWVFNLAADMGGMGFIESHKAHCMLSVLIGSQMLVAARDADAQRFFFASSACVYNAAKQTTVQAPALRESDAYPADPEDGYGWEKLFTERLCNHFFEDFGLDTRVARYHNVYGTHGTWDGGREKAPAAICRKVAIAAITGDTEIEIWGDGEQTRSFTHVDDCTEGTLRLMNSGVREPINVGSSELVSINQLVDIVEQIAGVRLKRKYDLGAPKGVRGRNSDNTMIQSLLGWQPSIGLEEGLSQTYAWIYDQVKMGKQDVSLVGRPRVIAPSLSIAHSNGIHHAETLHVGS